MEKAIFLLLVFCKVISAVDLPSGMSGHQYCEGCISTVKELSKKLSRKTDSKSILVMDSMERVCSPQNFVSYEYSPPRTVKACKLLLERHEEAIENFLINDGKDAEKKICYEISNACTDIDRDAKPKDYGDIDLSGNGKGSKSSKVVDIDPATGKAVVKEEKADKSTTAEAPKKAGKATEKRSSGKTLSKKDKKKKTEEKSKSKKEEKSKKSKKEEKPKAEDGKQKGKKSKGGVDFLNVNINDPDSIKNVMEQINQIKKDHEREWNEKRERDEL